VKGTHADRSKLTAKGNIRQWDDGKSAEVKAMIPDELARAVFKVVSSSISEPHKQEAIV
jgi:hypothetical protein